MGLLFTKFLMRTGLYRLSPRLRKRVEGYRPHVHRLADRLLSTPFEQMTDEALFPQLHGPDAIDLARPRPALRISFTIPRSIPDSTPVSGDPGFRQWIGLLDGVDPVREVLVTSGATAAFAATIDTFVNPGDAVVVFDPTSPMISLGLSHRRARIRRIRCINRQGRLEFDVIAFRSAMRGAKMVVLDDPHNPTGGGFSPEDLEQIAFWADRFDVLIYRDETYASFQSDPKRVCFQTLPHARNRSLTARGVSPWGLGALRIGWLSGSSPLIDLIGVSAAFGASLPAPLSQVVARETLIDASAKIDAMAVELRDLGRYAFERLRLMGLDPTVPANGPYLWVPLPAGRTDGRRFSREFVLDRRVLVAAGEPFGPGGVGHVRLSFAVDEGRLREGLNRLASYLASRPAIAEAAEKVAKIP